MVIYSSTKSGFHEDVLSGDIDSKILTLMQSKGHSVGGREVQSWRNSLMYMNNVLADEEIPRDVGVSIEYRIPNSNKRIDFVLTGTDSSSKGSVILVELKQWTSAESTDKASIVRTQLQGRLCEVPHPSYQAWSYAKLLEDFNSVIQEESISIRPCAYLHNYDYDDVINGAKYTQDLARAPLFLKTDAMKLRQFIKKWIRFGDKNDLMYKIDGGKIRPSKSLADELVSLMQGNPEFTLIDEQKVVYETAIELASTPLKKQVLIVEGGPGTGKSVLAINLIVEMTNRKKVAQYVSKNSAPRAVYEAKLTGSYKKSHLSNLFKGSGSFVEADRNSFDVLVVDEAHRLNEKSGLYGNLGENQIKEIIYASKFSLFFVDESQRVTVKDIGSVEEIKKWAKKLGAQITEMELPSQFRCNGSDGYIAWLDNSLQVRPTANTFAVDLDYDLRIYDSLTEMFEEIKKLNFVRNKARMVAGYCWDWNSKTDSKKQDIVIPSQKFQAQWNLAGDGGLWAIAEKSVDQVGCVHTCQGLEMDYVGVIIGSDLIVRNGFVQTDYRKRSKMDHSIRGIKKLAQVDQTKADSLADEIIKNTYRTLMSRGSKGCFIFSEDDETREYFLSAVGKSYQQPASLSFVAEPGLEYRPSVIPKKIKR